MIRLIKLRRRVLVFVRNASFNSDIADNFWKRAKGLIGSKFLKDNEGMLFVFFRPGRKVFWMKGMKFAIDIIWIKKGVIIGMEKNALPETGTPIFKSKKYVSPPGTDMALEIAAGASEKFSLKIGDAVVLSKNSF